MQANYGLFIGLIVGFGLAAQGPINARLADHLNGTAPAAVISFTVGLLSLLAVSLIARQPLPTVSGLQTAPLWALIGGLFGAAVVTGAAFFVPKIGAATWVTVIIVGQLVAAMAIDHFGWLGVQPRSIDWSRVAGALVLVLGVYLIQRTPQ